MLCSNPDDIYDDEIREKVKLVKEGEDIVTMCEVLDEVIMAERRAARAKLAKKNRELKRKDEELKRKNEEIERLNQKVKRMEQEKVFSSGS